MEETTRTIVSNSLIILCCLITVIAIMRINIAKSDLTTKLCYYDSDKKLKRVLSRLDWLIMLPQMLAFAGAPMCLGFVIDSECFYHINIAKELWFLVYPIFIGNIVMQTIFMLIIRREYSTDVIYQLELDNLRERAIQSSKLIIFGGVLGVMAFFI